jgi:hypothetical protein
MLFTAAVFAWYSCTHCSCVQIPERVSFSAAQMMDSRHFSECFNGTDPFLIIVSLIIKKLFDFYGTRGSVPGSKKP